MSSIAAGVWALSCALSAPPCPAQASGALGLSDALHYALEHAPQMAQAKEQLKIRGWESDQARAKFLPSLDLTTNQGFLKTEPGQTATLQSSPSSGGVYTTSTTETPWFGQLGLNLTETLYDNGQSLTQRDISTANQEAARLTAMMTRDDVLLAVTKAYYALSQAEILLETNRQQTQLLDKELGQLDAFYHQGLKTKKEYLRLKSQAQRAALDVMNAEAARKAAEVDLRKAMGAEDGAAALTFRTLNAEEVLRATPVFPTVPPPVDSSYVAKIAEREDAVQAATVELARRKNLPVLQVTSGLGYQVPDYLGTQGRPWAQDYLSWNVTVAVTYNIWDDGSRRHDIDIAASQRFIHSQDTNDKLQSLRADITKLMENLHNLQAGWQLNKELIRLEQENFANLQEDYRQGKVAYLDLVSGLNDLLTAKVTFYTTYVSILTDLAQYRYYEGTIYDMGTGV